MYVGIYALMLLFWLVATFFGIGTQMTYFYRNDVVSKGDSEYSIPVPALQALALALHYLWMWKPWLKQLAPALAR